MRSASVLNLEARCRAIHAIHATHEHVEANHCDYKRLQATQHGRNTLWKPLIECSDFATCGYDIRCSCRMLTARPARTAVARADSIWQAAARWKMEETLIEMKVPSQPQG